VVDAALMKAKGIKYGGANFKKHYHIFDAV